MIHVLGDGPYAREVVDQLNFQDYGEFTFHSSDNDDSGLEQAIIGIASPSIKRRVVEKYLDMNPKMTIWLSIHRKTIYFGQNVDYHCVNIGPMSSIGSNTKIEDFVCICANVTIGHNVIIGRYSTICPGAIVSGNVSIGEGTFIGAGAVIKDNISIDGNVTIGCGAVVIRDVEDNHIVAGNPAKVIGLNDSA